MANDSRGAIARVFWGGVVAAAGLLFSGVVNSAVISAGTPTTTVPSSLIDPFASLVGSPLPDGQFLLPVEITGANGLQDWSFDLLFDANIVNPADVGGLYQSVYQAEFNAIDLTPSNITSSGFLGADVLAGIAGFSGGVSGDGLLAYVLFQYLQGQQNNDPGFGIDKAITQQAPEAGTLALLLAALASLYMQRRFARDATPPPMS